jgi:DNA-binding CsgD family transcriptional regulator
MELTVLRAVVERGTVAKAAEALCLSRHTVDWHLKQLRSKTGLHHLPQLAVWAVQQGHLQAADFVFS